MQYEFIKISVQLLKHDSGITCIVYCKEFREKVVNKFLNIMYDIILWNENNNIANYHYKYVAEIKKVIYNFTLFTLNVNRWHH